MFTGVIVDMGRVRAVESRGNTRLIVETRLDTGAMPIGASIACSGACLTVVDKGSGWFAVDLSEETLSRTTLGDWEAGAPVNLERPLKLGDELGGHILLGHVDGIARLVEREPEAASLRLGFEAPPELARFLAPKGSVALDGVSLTVNEVSGERFGVNLIPYTRRMTSLGGLEPGGAVNLEVDVLARYVARLAETSGR